MTHIVNKTSLAQAYFPTLNPRSARNKLMQLINDDYSIYSQLLPLGYTRRCRFLTPKMLGVIFAHLGNPYAH